MVKEGRTIRQAIDAGTAYRISHPEHFRFGYFPPAAESPQEVIGCLRDMTRRGWISPVPAGTVFKVDHILDTSPGCYVIEDIGEIVF